MDGSAARYSRRSIPDRHSSRRRNLAQFLHFPRSTLSLKTAEPQRKVSGARASDRARRFQVGVRTQATAAGGHAGGMKAPGERHTPAGRAAARARYFMRSIIALPKPEQDTCVAPSISRAKS
jgi:hypothetical protein